jgi:membrane fusion protein (multidrug efflux system)
MQSLVSRNLWLLAAVLLLPLMFGCSQEQDTKAKKEKKAHLVEAVTVNLSTAGVEQIRTGTLRALREVKIHNQEDGQVIKLPYYEGDAVNKGAVVARLDDKLLLAQLARAQATLQQAKQDLDRTKNLFKKNLVSDEELSRAKTALEVARADEEVLATRVSYTTIRAPISGVVSARLSEPGNIAERHTHLLTISDPTSLVTEVTLSELLISKLSLNHPVSVSVDALGSQVFEGHVSRIYPNLDPITRRGTIEVELKPVPEGARPGQLCRVKLKTNAASRLIIPFSALRRDQVEEYVFVIDEDLKVQRTKVVGGLRIGEQVEILDGLAEGQQVVTKGFLDLVPGKKVKVVSRDKNSKTDRQLSNKPEVSSDVPDNS